VASFGAVAAGAYRLVFDTAAHSQFFPRVSVEFIVGEERLHVPLLLNPFGYSTYRGS
jgi:5-hydroxyisourate hydrolase